MRNPINLTKAIIIGTISALLFGENVYGYRLAVINDIHADLNYNPSS